MNVNSFTFGPNDVSNIDKLNDQIPYSLVRGNHDCFNREDEKAAHEGIEPPVDAKFIEYFDTEEYAKQYTGKYETIENTYSLCEIEGHKYLFINLDYGPSDDVLNWAGDLCDTHKDYDVVMSTHCFLFRNGQPLTDQDVYPPTAEFRENDGDDIWEKFGSKHENISLILCGHDPVNNIVYNTFKGNNGNDVKSILIDEQYNDKFIAPSGMVCLLHFRNGGRDISLETYSTTFKKFYKLNNQIAHI